MKSGVFQLSTWLIVAIAGLWLVACGSNGPPKTPSESVSPSKDCQTVAHDWGETQICGQPRRIIALDPHALDLLLALGLEPIGYAEDGRALTGTPESGQPAIAVKYLGDRLNTLPIHVGTAQSPSLETLVKLNPDLILGRFYSRSQVEMLSQIAPVLFPFQSDSERDRWQTSLFSLAEVVGRQPQAARVIQQHEERIARAKATLKPVSQGQKVLLLSMSGIGSISAFIDESFAGELLQDLGFQLLIPEQLPITNGEILLSLEVLPQLEPDLIIVMASGNSRVEQIKSLWQEHPILRSLPATHNHQVYFVDYQLWSRITGPNAAELIIEQIQDLILK